MSLAEIPPGRIGRGAYDLGTGAELHWMLPMSAEVGRIFPQRYHIWSGMLLFHHSERAGDDDGREDILVSKRKVQALDDKE